MRLAAQLIEVMVSEVMVSEVMVSEVMVSEVVVNKVVMDGATLESGGKVVQRTWPSTFPCLSRLRWSFNTDFQG